MSHSTLTLSLVLFSLLHFIGEPRPPGVDDDEEEEEPRPPGVEDEVADDDCVIVRESRVYRCEVSELSHGLIYLALLIMVLEYFCCIFFRVWYVDCI